MITVLDGLVKSGDVEGFRAFQYRVNHHGQPPPRSYSNAGSSSNYASQNGYDNYMAPGRSMPSSSRMPMGSRSK